MARHIPVEVWLERLGMQQYQHLFQSFTGVENMLSLTESDINNLGVTNPAHRAHISSSLVILREKIKLKEKSRLSQPPPVTNLSLSSGADSNPDYASLKRQTLAGRTSLPGEQTHHVKVIRQPLVLVGESWYHGNIPRGKAEKMLKQDGDFLVRDSISQPGEFVLTCHWCHGPLHFKINSQMLTLPDGTTKVRYQFEDDLFDDVSQLVNFYVSKKKRVSEKSGAILKTPIARTKPLDHYTSKRDSLRGSRLYAARSQPNIFKMSPELTPAGSPKSSPGSERRKPQRCGSQPLLSLDDDGSNSSDGEKPVLGRHESMPVSQRSLKQATKQLAHEENAYSELRVKQINGSNSPDDKSGTNIGSDDNTKESSENPSPAQTVSSKHSPQPLPAKPPPKPSRIPSVKLLKKQQKPFVLKRNLDLYEDDDRDYSDYSQVKSWTSAGFTADHKRNEDDECYAELPKADPKKTMDLLRRKSHLDSGVTYDIPTNSQSVAETENESLDNLVSMPLENMPSYIDFNNYSSELLPPNNKPMDNTAVTTIKMLLLDSNPQYLAQHVTWIDLDLLMIVRGQDLGVMVTSGLEMITLPQGKQLRQDLLERYHCMKLFVALTVLVCTRYQDRARMIQQWVQVAEELQGDMGNHLGFAAVMEGLRLPQVARLHSSWVAVKQNFPTAMHLYEAKLVSSIQCMEGAMSSLPLQNVTVPYVLPVVEGLEKESWDSTNRAVWEIDASNFYGIDIMLAHMDTARIVTEQCGLYKITGHNLLKGFRPDSAVLDVFRTEMHMNLMWGAKGVGADRNERYNKFNQLLNVLSERAEPSYSAKTETSV